MSFIKISERQSISLTIFLSPPQAPKEPATFPCVFTQEGMTRMRLDPTNFSVSMSRLKQELGTRIVLIHGPDTMFIDGHTAACDDYLQAIEAARKFEDAIMRHLGFRCLIYYPEKDMPVARAAA